MTGMPVARYLSLHYRTTAQLATGCGVTIATLESLVDAGLVPAPSYRVDANGVVESVVFGHFAGADAAPGAYFHPGTTRWVRRAMRQAALVGAGNARDALRGDFERRFAGALRRVDRTLVRLDAFARDGRADSDAIEFRCDVAWGHLMDGTFGLCVRDCASVHAIARKEVLQEHLTRLAVQDSIDARHVDRLVGLIDLYADAAMPFAPPEYASSSRKRLVEDFGVRLRALRPVEPEASPAAASTPRRSMSDFVSCSAPAP